MPSIDISFLCLILLRFLTPLETAKIAEGYDNTSLLQNNFSALFDKNFLFRGKIIGKLQLYVNEN